MSAGRLALVNLYKAILISMEVLFGAIDFNTAERMRGMFEKSYVLNFDRQASIFKEEEVLEAPV